MSFKVPMFPVGEPAETWDDLTLLAATVFLEAEGEPDLGKLAVAYVVMNRGKTVLNAVLGPDGKAYGDGKPYEAFSCWNDDYKQQAATRLSTCGNRAEAAWRAAAAAFWGLISDPTSGADHYLNVELTRKIRGGSLPTWAEGPIGRDQGIKIGNHTFLRLP